MIFWRTHWAWAVEWEEWNSRTNRWDYRSTHYGDHDTALERWDRIRKMPPDVGVRNVKLNRRPVGAPRTWLRSS